MKTKRVVVNGSWTYETDLRVKVGTRVLLPTADWLRDVKGPTFEGTVTSMESTYNGFCNRIVAILPKKRSKPLDNPATRGRVRMS